MSKDIAKIWVQHGVLTTTVPSPLVASLIGFGGTQIVSAGLARGPAGVYE